MAKRATAEESFGLAGGTRGIYLGRFWDDETKDWLPRPLVYEDERHGLLFGPTGCGKTTRWMMSNLLGDYLRAASVFVVDPKAELAAVCAKARVGLGQNVRIIDPFNKLREIVAANPSAYTELAQSCEIDGYGFEPLDTLNASSPNFYDDAAAIAEALIEVEERDSHWSQSARGLITGLIMWEKVRNTLAGTPDAASLIEVRRLLTERERKTKHLRKVKDEDGLIVLDNDGNPVTETVEVPVAGMVATVGKALKAESDERKKLETTGGFDVPYSLDTIASLLTRFGTINREILSIISVADTQTRWILSTPIQRNLRRKPSVNFADLKTGAKPSTYFLILPAERIRTHAAWMKLLIVSCMRALSTRGGRRTVFLIDEMPALGRLEALSDAFAIVRGFNIQIFGIAQDVVQLKHLYRERYESFLANAGVIQFFGPNDMTTAKFVSERAGTEIVNIKNLSDNESPSGELSKGIGQHSELQPIYSPQTLMGQTTGSGLLFLATLSESVRFYTPRYSDIDQTDQRALPNPYHNG